MNAEENLRRANAMCKNTLMEHLGIQFQKVEEGKIEATLPVDHRTHQPMGLLHGGASAALAESIGSLGSAMLLDVKTQSVVGIEINANHLKSIKNGTVTGRGELLHRGKKIHVWEIKIYNAENDLISVCRLTNMILENKK